MPPQFSGSYDRILYPPMPSLQGCGSATKNLPDPGQVLIFHIFSGSGQLKKFRINKFVYNCYSACLIIFGMKSRWPGASSRVTRRCSVSNWKKKSYAIIKQRVRYQQDFPVRLVTVLIFTFQQNSKTLPSNPVKSIFLVPVPTMRLQYKGR